MAEFPLFFVVDQIEDLLGLTLQMSVGIVQTVKAQGLLTELIEIPRPRQGVDHGQFQNGINGIVEHLDFRVFAYLAFLIRSWPAQSQLIDQ